MNQLNQFDRKHYFFHRDSKSAYGYPLCPSDFAQTKQQDLADKWVFAVALICGFLLVIM